MMAFFSLFQSSTKTATTVEDVFLAIGVLINSQCYFRIHYLLMVSARRGFSTLHGDVRSFSLRGSSKSRRTSGLVK
jgi:hypothetical protein